MAQSENYAVYSHYRILGVASTDNIKKHLTSDKVFSKSFCACDEIFSPKQEKHCVGIILRGSAVVVPTSSGENAMLKILSPDDMFGIANLYASYEPFPSLIRAKTDCEVLFIDGEAFKSLIENDTAALHEYLALLNQKIIYLNKKISTLTAGSTEKKLAFYLAEHECNGEVSQNVSMSALADMLNIGRASLYRALDALASCGLIRREGKRIIILDKNALLNFNSGEIFI